MQTTTVKLQLLLFEQKKKIPFSSSYTLGLGVSKCSHKHPSFLWDQDAESDTALLQQHLCGEQEPESQGRLTGANCILCRCLTRQDSSLE